MEQKYKTLLDDEMLAFIELSQTFYPENSEQLSIAEQRQFYNTMCQHFHAGRPDGITAMDSEIETPDGALLIRSYQLTGSKPAAQVAYYHGGGYVFGDLDSHDDVCAEICARTGFPVTSVAYRLAPEHTFPADFNDAVYGFQHAAGLSQLPVIVAGDSAGANLAAAVCHATRNSAQKPIGQVLIYPGLGSDMTRGSFVEHAEAPMLTTRETNFYKNARTGQNPKLLEKATCSPLNDTDFTNLPPTKIFAAECDPLRDDGPAYAAKITAAGGTAICHIQPSLTHGHLRARHSVIRAKEAFSEIVETIEELGTGS